MYQQIEEMAMIPAKEAKELLYTMFAQKFVSITVSTVKAPLHPFSNKPLFLALLYSETIGGIDMP